MKIYEISGSVDAADGGTMINWYFAPTKTGARAILQEIKENCPDTDCEISEWEIKPTKAGIAQALQDLVDQTCLNEG